MRDSKVYLSLWLLACLQGVLTPQTTFAKSGHERVYWLQLERGDSLEARGVERATADSVRYRGPDGTVGYVPVDRLAHIYDASGTDLKFMVLQHRARLGEPVTPKHHSFCFRGGDKTCCTSFLIFETGTFVPLKAERAERGLYYSADLGAMVNVGRASAVGASAFWESGSDRNRSGLRLRYRHWVGFRTSFELAPGIAVGGDDEFDGPGFIAQAAFNIGDLMSFVLETEPDGHVYSVWNGTSYESRRRSEMTFRAGVRGGSYVAAGTTIVVAAAFLVLVATLNGSY